VCCKLGTGLSFRTIESNMRTRDHKKRTADWLSKLLLILNVMGAIVYVMRASAIWAIPQERTSGITWITADPYVWLGTIFPIFTGDHAWARVQDLLHRFAGRQFFQNKFDRDASPDNNGLPHQDLGI